MFERTWETKKNLPSYQILFVPALLNPQVEKTKSVIFPLVSQYLGHHSFFPHIHLDQYGTSKKAEICQNIRNALVANEIDQTNVFCALTREEETRKRFVFQAPPPPGNNSDEQTVRYFHMLFWIFLMLIVGLIWSFYAIAYIPSDPTLSQSSTYIKKNVNQKWQ